jgi:hypothetical protein
LSFATRLGVESVTQNADAFGHGVPRQTRCHEAMLAK